MVGVCNCALNKGDILHSRVGYICLDGVKQILHNWLLLWHKYRYLHNWLRNCADRWCIDIYYSHMVSIIESLKLHHGSCTVIFTDDCVLICVGCERYLDILNWDGGVLVLFKIMENSIDGRIFCLYCFDIIWCDMHSVLCLVNGHVHGLMTTQNNFLFDIGEHSDGVVWYNIPPISFFCLIH